MIGTRESVVIAGVSGSLRSGSYTSMAVQMALRGAERFGARAVFLDLAAYGLTLLDSSRGTPGLERWRADVAMADGLILGTPEYHGSFSGVLKNALDYLDLEQTEGKMIGLVGVSGGAMGAFDAMNGLRSVGRAMHSWVVPLQAAVPEASKAFSSNGEVRNAELEKRLLEVGEQVARFAHLHKCGAVGEFLDVWQRAPVNPAESGRLE